MTATREDVPEVSCPSVKQTIAFRRDPRVREALFVLDHRCPGASSVHPDQAAEIVQRLAFSVSLCRQQGQCPKVMLRMSRVLQNDTGHTLRFLLENLRSRDPASLKSCVLVRKPTRAQVEVCPDFLGFDIPDVWVVGYGLDYADTHRTLPFIAELKRP